MGMSFVAILEINSEQLHILPFGPVSLSGGDLGLFFWRSQAFQFCYQRVEVSILHQLLVLCHMVKRKQLDLGTVQELLRRFFAAALVCAT